MVTENDNNNNNDKNKPMLKTPGQTVIFICYISLVFFLYT